MKADSRSGRSLARCGRLRAMIWPGTPTTTELGGTDLTTTALAPMRLSSPDRDHPSTLAPAPMVTRLPMVGWRLTRSRLVPPKVTPW